MVTAGGDKKRRQSGAQTINVHVEKVIIVRYHLLTFVNFVIYQYFDPAHKDGIWFVNLALYSVQPLHLNIPVSLHTKKNIRIEKCNNSLKTRHI